MNTNVASEYWKTSGQPPIIYMEFDFRGWERTENNSKRQNWCKHYLFFFANHHILYTEYIIISLDRKSSSSHLDILMASGPSITPFTTGCRIYIHSWMVSQTHTHPNTHFHTSHWRSMANEFICLVMHPHTHFLNHSLLTLILVCGAGDWHVHTHTHTILALSQRHIEMHRKLNLKCIITIDNPLLAPFVTSWFFKSFLIPVYFFLNDHLLGRLSFNSRFPVMTVFDVSTALYYVYLFQWKNCPSYHKYSSLRFHFD